MLLGEVSEHVPHCTTFKGPLPEFYSRNFLAVPSPLIRAAERNWREREASVLVALASAFRLELLIAAVPFPLSFSSNSFNARSLVEVKWPR
jgi:hypothetical protein